MDAAEGGADQEAQAEPVPEQPDTEPEALGGVTEAEREAAATVVSLRHSMSSSLGASPDTLTAGTPTQQPSPLAGSTPRRLPSVKTPDEGSRTAQTSSDRFVTAAEHFGMPSAFVEDELAAEEALRACRQRTRKRADHRGDAPQASRTRNQEKVNGQNEHRRQDTKNNTRASTSVSGAASNSKIHGGTAAVTRSSTDTGAAAAPNSENDDRRKDRYPTDTLEEDAGRYESSG